MTVKTTFIYGLFDPITKELRYVGKSDDPIKRLSKHIRDAKRTTYLGVRKNRMKLQKRIKFQAVMLGVMIAISVMAIAISASCRSKNVNEDNFSYRIIEVQKMTCIQWGNPISYKGGLTCNWEEWEGKE